MTSPDEAQRLLAGRLSPRRLEHSRRVAATAVELARRWGAPPDAAEVAGLLHDYCREVTADEILAAVRRYGIPMGATEARRPVGLLHGPVAAAELRALGVDEDVCRAIARHTVGAPGMSALDKCVYLADFCEPGRESYATDQVRAIAASSLDEAVGAAARYSLLDLITRRRGVVPDALALYNEHHGGA